MQVNIHEAKTHLSRLLERVCAGEEVIIAKAGRPIARVVPFENPKASRKPDTCAGLIWVADDFNDPLPDSILADFER